MVEKSSFLENTAPKVVRDLAKISKAQEELLRHLMLRSTGGRLSSVNSESLALLVLISQSFLLKAERAL